jgi:hypothetical protein
MNSMPLIEQEYKALLNEMKKRFNNVKEVGRNHRPSSKC